MKKILILSAIFLAVLPNLSEAAKTKVEAKTSTPPCKPMYWSYSREQSLEDLHAIFDRLDRRTLIQYLYGELSQPSSPSLAFPLIRFLSQTEPNKNMRAYYLLLGEASEVREENRQPVRALALREMCSIRDKADRLKR